MTKSVTIQVSDTAAIKIQIWFESASQAFRGQCVIVHQHVSEGWDLDEPYSSEVFRLADVYRCAIASGPDLVSNLHSDFCQLLATISKAGTTDFDRYLSLGGTKRLIEAYFELAIREDLCRRRAAGTWLTHAYDPCGLIS